MANKKVKKQAPKKRTEAPPEYVLVLYRKNSTVGVVKRRDVRVKNFVKGASCMAPDAIELNVEENDANVKRYDAVIVEFGHDIEYLYGLDVDMDGNVMLVQDQNVPIAKRMSKRDAEAAKEEEMRQLDEEIQLLPPLSTTQSSEINEDQGFDDDPKETNTSFVPVSKEIESTSYSGNSSGHTDSVHASTSHDSSPNYSGFLINSNHLNCPIPNECPFIEALKQATPENLRFLNNLYSTILSHQVVQVPVPGIIEQHQQSAQNLEENLDCLKMTDGKFRLVQSIDVFLPKTEILSLPVVVPQKAEEKGRRKPKESGRLYPRGMVAYLLNKLIPVDILKTLTAKEVPRIIFLAIKCYINFKLPEGQKIFDEKVTEWISDTIRGHNRNRTGESARIAQLAGLYKPRKRKADEAPQEAVDMGE